MLGPQQDLTQNTPKLWTCTDNDINIKKILQEKAVEATKQKEEERENLSPRNR
jgi:hypothetical protein